MKLKKLFSQNHFTSFSYIFAIRLTQLGSTMILFVILGGCGLYLKTPDVTIGVPKVYTDDQVSKTLAEHRTAILQASKGITPKTLQEIFGVKQATKTESSISVSPSLEGLVKAPELKGSKDIDLPSSSEPSSEIGLGFSSLLRKILVRDQLLMGTDLLYLGDSNILNDDNQAVLLRFDISINNFGERLIFSGQKDYAEVAFTINACERENRISDRKIAVYALAPDYTTRVAKESLISSDIASDATLIGATIEGVDIKAARRRQKALEENLLTLVEFPLQFAIYGESHNSLLSTNSFGFAFGPRRKIVKRSWLNPARILGNTYRIDYEIEAGPRDVYAIVVLPKTADKLRIQASANREFISRNFSKIHKQLVSELKEPTDTCNYTDTTRNQDSVGDEFFVDTRNAMASMPIFATTLGVEPVPVPKKLLDYWYTLPKTEPPGSCEVSPKVLFPSLTNHFIIICDTSISSETEVLIGNVYLPKPNITLLGRKKIKVTVPPDLGLEEILNSPNPEKKLDVQVIAPGREWEIMKKEITLMSSEKPLVEPGLTLTPDRGIAGESVMLKIKGEDLSKVHAIQIGGVEVKKSTFIQLDSENSDKLIFTIPTPPTTGETAKVSLIVFFGDPEDKSSKRIFFPSAFTYQKPSQTMSANSNQ